MEETEQREKAVVPSFLLGQLIATARLLEEDEKEQNDPTDNSLTVAETFFHEMIDRPEQTLKMIESKLLPRRSSLEQTGRKQLVRDMTLIYKIKNQYKMAEGQLDEEEFFKGYNQQLQKYYKAD